MTAGYQGLENQLYRVQIHTGGDPTTARVVWSRESGSVTLPVIAQGPNQVTVGNLGRDDTLGLAANQWVELLDDRLELLGATVPLVQIDQPDPEHLTVGLRPGATGVPTLEPARHAKLRRWDHSDANADAGGIPIPTNGWLDPEYGLQIQLTGTSFRSGDYWHIPARTGLGDGIGSIDWPQTSGAPANLGPTGVQRRYVALAFVSFDPVTQAFTALTPSCLPTFPNLTHLDDMGECTWLIRPTDDLSAVSSWINASPSGGTVCFSAGTFDLPTPIVISQKSGIKVTGAGAATILTEYGDERVLVLDRCGDVIVRDLVLNSGREQDATGGGLLGALHITNCGSVTVADIAVTTSDRLTRDGSCITVINDPQTPAGDRIVTITDSTLRPGNEQLGALVVNCAKVVIRDCAIAGTTTPPPLLKDRLKDPIFRGRLLQSLVSDVLLDARAVTLVTTPSPGGQAPARVSSGAADRVFATPTPDVTMTVNGQTIAFNTVAGLAKSWPKIAESLGAPSTPLELYRALQKKAGDLITHGQLAGSPNFARWFNHIGASGQSVAAQGLCIAGKKIGQVIVDGVTMQNVVEGIRVAASARTPDGDQRTPDVVTSVVIRKCGIDTLIPPDARRQRFGAFLGNVDHAITRSSREIV